jgi:hypothetical protein
VRRPSLSEEEVRPKGGVPVNPIMYELEKSYKLNQEPVVAAKAE